MHENQLISEIRRRTNLTWFIAMGASKFISAPIEKLENVDVSRLLELRAFNGEHELKAVRGNLGEEFQVRDSKSYFEKSRTEQQYLDIDTTKGFKPGEGSVTVNAIAGGEYDLLNDGITKIELEHYYRADEKGIYRPFDFRIVRFL